MPPPLILSLISSTNRASGGRVTVNPKIDRSHDIKWMSILSNDGKTFYRDRSLKRFISNNGKILDIDKPLMEHEKAEYIEMSKEVESFKDEHGREPNNTERQKIYLSAHRKHGEVAEKKWIEANGYSWPQWNAWTRGELSRLEKKKATKPPPTEDVCLFAHGNNLETTLRADGGRINFAEGGDPENITPEVSHGEDYSVGLPDHPAYKLPSAQQPYDMPKLIREMGTYMPRHRAPVIPEGDTRQSLTEYHPTWRDKLARTILGNNPSVSSERSVKELIGSKGLGNTGISLADITPAGIPLAMEEASKSGNIADMAMAVAPPARALKPLAQSLKGAIRGSYSPIESGEGLTKQVFKPAGPKAEELKASGAATPDYHELTPEGAEHFANSINEAKEAHPHGYSVYSYDPEEYKNMRMFLTPDSKAGFALKGDDIVSVFKHPEHKGKDITKSMLDLATSQGGKRLDTFDPVLPKKYAESGFKPVARSPWNDEFLMPGWDTEKSGTPDVVYMTHDPNYREPYKSGEVKTVSNPEEGSIAQKEALSGAKPEDYSPLQGLPKNIDIPGQGKIEAGPFPTARRIAREYMDESGLPYNPPKTFAKVDKDRAGRISNAFDEMKHDYDNPETRASYEAMAKETMAQWQKIKDSGLNVDFIEGKDPYAASPRLAIEDIKNNNHMWVFPTDSGFGESAISAEDSAKNPLLKLSGETISGKPARINDIFRIVHDYFGHAKEGVGFRSDGEENAWRSHAAMYSPVARKAMTTETRGQNSWVNYGPHGGKNRTASGADTIFADQKFGLLPDWAVEEGRHDPGIDVSHPDWIDQRLPTSKKPTDSGDKIVDLNSMKQSPSSYEKNIDRVREYPNTLEKIANTATTDEMAEHFINHVKDNVLWLHDQVNPDIRSRSKQWYAGARKIVGDWAKEFGVRDSTVAGVMAALSPQMPWFTNLSLARRLLDINSKLRDVSMTSEMESTFRSIASLQKDKPLFNMIRGKTLNEIDDIKIPNDEKAVLKSIWTRLYDEAHHSKDHQIVTPEGDWAGVKKNNSGNPEKIKWGSLPMISKAISVFDANGGRESNNVLMGMKHKIRNFYNNLLVPNSNKGDVTIDTHAVAAGLLRPLAGEDLEVLHNFKSYAGKGNPGASGSDITGVRGTYPLYAEAYRRAAKERNILPREMQSITWEAIRGLFPEDLKGAKLSKIANDIWDEYRTGKATINETRQKILEAGGGIRDPEWARSPPKSNETSRGASDKGELPEPSLYGPATQKPGSGGRPTGRPKVGGGRFYPKRESADERNYLAGSAVDEAFRQAGMPELKPGPTRDRVIDLVGRRGDDPLDVYERVIMEEEGNAGTKPVPPPKVKGKPKQSPPVEDVPFASGGAVNRADGGHLNEANEALGFNSQEGDLYRRHLDNLRGSGGVDNPDGSRSSLYQAVIGHNGKFYNIPTVRNGSILPVDQAADAAFDEGIDKFPSYVSPEEADDRYDQMHKFMEQDTFDYFNSKKNFADGGSPSDDQLASSMTHQPEQPNPAQPYLDFTKQVGQATYNTVLGRALDAAKNLTSRAMSGEYVSEDPNIGPQALTAVSLGTTSRMPFVKPGTVGSFGTHMVQPEIPTPSPAPKSITAYHGSGADFDKFDINKIGTGEGAQAFGHGLYFAESEPVAKSYREMLSEPGARIKSKDYDIDTLNSRDYPTRMAGAMIHQEGNLGSAIKRAEENQHLYPELYDLLKKWHSDNAEIHPHGKMYQVKIHSDPDKFLDWNKPLSEQHEVVQKALEPVKNMYGSYTGPDWSTKYGAPETGAEALEALERYFGNPAEASEYLHSAGVPGVRYLDAASKKAGEGTRNYVVFDDKIVDILKKYGLAGLSAIPASGISHFNDKDIPQQRAFGGRINHNPTEDQKRAGNYKKGHIRLHGLDISIENAKGSTRSGVNKDGTKWKSTLPAHYGYIKGSKGADEDHIDVYVGPNHNSSKIFVVNQKDAENGSFDEHKSFIGFSNIAQVKNTFLRAFSDGKGKKRMGYITEMTVPEFKSFIEAETDKHATKS